MNTTTSTLKRESDDELDKHLWLIDFDTELLGNACAVNFSDVPSGEGSVPCTIRALTEAEEEEEMRKGAFPDLPDDPIASVKDIPTKERAGVSARREYGGIPAHNWRCHHQD